MTIRPTKIGDIAFRKNGVSGKLRGPFFCLKKNHSSINVTRVDAVAVYINVL